MIVALVVIAALGALAYGALWCNEEPSAVRSASKTIPLVALALVGWTLGAPALLVGALSLSALGDLLLSRESDGYFLAGMAAFFATHVAYATLFLGGANIGFVLESRLVYVAILAVYAMGIARFIWAGLGAFRLPVSLYLFAIATMGTSALGLPFGAPTGYAVAGVLLFILSDTFLAVEKFRPDFWPAFRCVSPYLVWASYIAAQSLILLGAASL